jgi:hypothetical protein
MMIKSTVIAVSALLFSSSVYASCEGKDKLLFACLTEKGKQIEVCNFGQTIRYSYGRPNAKPEIVVIVPREKVAGNSCYACGRYITSSVTIPNENAFYQVTWSADKLQESDKLEGGVQVLINGTSKFISCQSEPSIGNTEGIHFEEESGQ